VCTLLNTKICFITWLYNCFYSTLFRSPLLCISKNFNRKQNLCFVCFNLTRSLGFLMNENRRFNSVSVESLEMRYFTLDFSLHSERARRLWNVLACTFVQEKKTLNTLHYRFSWLFLLNKRFFFVAIFKWKQKRICFQPSMFFFAFTSIRWKTHFLFFSFPLLILHKFPSF
jgi:hypothetical protein